MNNNTKILAAIFDLDGTVLSNEYDYGKAFNAVLMSLGVDSHEKYPQLGGIGVTENWVKFIDKFKIKTEKTAQQLSHETQEKYLELLPQIELKEGFWELIESLRQADVLTALATSNEWWIVEEVMQKFDLAKYFDAVTTGEEPKYKKPDPDIFLITARKLGVEYDQCVVFEDSEAGIAAAKEAGMLSVGVARDEVMRRLLGNADMVVADFTEISPDFIN